MKEKFATADELYEYVLPAIKIRTKNLKNEGYNIEEKDVWRHLSKHWRTCKNLTLYDIVHDILHFKIEL